MTSRTSTGQGAPGPRSAATMSNTRQNLVFAFIFNVAGIPIATGLLYPRLGCCCPR